MPGIRLFGWMAVPRLCEIIVIRSFLAGDEALGGGALFALTAGIEKAGDGEYHRSYKVDQQILHGIDEANIQIAAHPQRFPIDDHVVDPLYRHDPVAAGGIQTGGVDGVYHRVPLHIRMEKTVHPKLEKLPQYADGHGKAESHHSQKERREVEGQLVVVIEQQHHGKAHSGGQKPVDGVEHGVPVGNSDIEGVDLT